MVSIGGENGHSLNIELIRDGSRVADFFLSGGGGFPMGGLTVRPMFAGGINDTTYAALQRIAGGEVVRDAGQFRKRPPVVLLGDNVGGDGEFTYLELSSDTKGFQLQWHNVGGAGLQEPPIRFSDPDAVAALTVLYQAIAKDQKHTTAFFSRMLADPHSSLADTFSRNNWDEGMALLSDYTEPNQQAAIERMMFDKIKQTGILLLKLGIPLPEAIRGEWAAHFGLSTETTAQRGTLR